VKDVADAAEDVMDEVEGKGGVFGTTHGLQKTFGISRCYNTPLAEANIVGRGIGQAMRGLRPCAEVQFFDYIWPAMHQIRAEAATTRWRSQGQFTVPLVIRVAIGGYVRGGSLWHSQCGESIFAHIPGLIVIFPSRARDAVADSSGRRSGARTRSSFSSTSTCCGQKYAMDPFPAADYVLPLGKAAKVREGNHLSIVTWGATVQKSLDAAKRLEMDGLSTEVIDLRTIIPWDREAVATTVARTSKLLVVHEDVLTCGFGAEVAAVGGRALFLRPRRAGGQSRRHRHLRPLTSRPSSRRSCHRWTTSNRLRGSSPPSDELRKRGSTWLQTGAATPAPALRRRPCAPPRSAPL